MRHLFGALAVPVLAVAALAGCAARVPAPPPAPPGPPPGVEGRYRGTVRLVSGDRFCPKSGPRVYEVEGGAVTFSYSAPLRPGARPTRIPLTATIGPDGSFSANDGTGTLTGQLRDGTLEFSISSPSCEHRWTMRKVP